MNARRRELEPLWPALSLGTVGQRSGSAHGQLPRSYEATVTVLKVARVTFQRQALRSNKRLGAARGHFHFLPATSLRAVVLFANIVETQSDMIKTVAAHTFRFKAPRLEFCIHGRFSLTT